MLMNVEHLMSSVQLRIGYQAAFISIDLKTSMAKPLLKPETLYETSNT